MQEAPFALEAIVRECKEKRANDFQELNFLLR